MEKGEKHTDSEWLREQLEEKKRPVKEIAKEVNRDVVAIYYQMRKNDLETHHRSTKIKDEKGNRYGNVKVKKLSYISDDGHAVWKCKHDDGYEFEARGSDLRKEGKVTGSHSRPDGVTPFRQIYRAYKNGAEERGLVFELNRDQFRELTQKDCHYCGKPPSKSINREELKGQFTYNGLDRTNNSIGYTKDNVVPCCWECNSFKKDLDKEDFLELIERIYEYSLA